MYERGYVLPFWFIIFTGFIAALFWFVWVLWILACMGVLVLVVVGIAVYQVIRDKYRASHPIEKQDSNAIPEN